MWAAVILAPLVAAYIGPGGDSAAVAGKPDMLAATLRSLALSGVLAALAVVIAFVPARLLASASKGRAVLLVAVAACLLLPRYLLYYAWSLPAAPTTSLGRWLAGDITTARLAARAIAMMVLAGWYWPLAAMVIAQGWRDIDTDAIDAARLDAPAGRRFLHVTAPLLAPAVLLAFVLCAVMLMSEFATFQLAGIRTVGTELAVLYELTGSAPAVARAAWPLTLAAAVAAVLLWRSRRRFSANPQTGRATRPRRRPWRWAVTAVLLAWSLAVPIGLLVANLDTAGPLRELPAVHGDEIAWSLLVAAVGAVATVGIAAAALAAEGIGRPWRVVAIAAQTTMLMAMFLPGSLLAAGLLALLAGIGAPAAVRQSWLLVPAGLAARFAGLALIMLRLARDGQDRHLREMAAVDGATPLAAWWRVRLPRAWPILAATLIVSTMLGMTELPATMVLLPAGLPNFAQRLLNQMHYARDQEVITSSLVLVVTGLALAAVVVALMRKLAVGRSAVLLALAMLLPLAAVGCDRHKSTAGPGKAKVIAVFGSVGRGPGQFGYPRAAAIDHDGMIFVADKTGRVQRFTPGGRLLSVFWMPEWQAGKPTGMTVGPDGLLYVADTHYHRVLAFDDTGKVVRRFGKFGEQPGCFIYPTDIAFAGSGPSRRTFVSEYGGNDRVSIFDARGDYISSFGSPGGGDGQFSRPAALCIDESRGRLYVADACNHRIGVYDLDGNLQRYIGSPGRGAGELRYPYSVATLADGTLVVCEYGNNRIQLFSPDGRSLRILGGAGRAPGMLASPWAVVCDSADRVFIVDGGNNRVQVWKL